MRIKSMRSRRRVSCIWQRLLPLYRSCRAPHPRSTIRPGRSASSSVIRPAARPISFHASWLNGFRSVSASNSSSKTDPAPAATWAPRPWRRRRRTAPHVSWPTRRATIGASAFDKLNFNFIRDITPVASIGRIPLVMQVNPSFPAKTVPEFIEYAKARPGEINMASGGTGTITHIGGELFMMMTGVKLLHVPYRGAQFITGLLSGQVDVVFGILTASLSQIKAGGLRALAVTTATRSSALPDIPAVGEFVPGYEASSWGGIGAPRNTPVAIIDKLNKEINAGLADPEDHGTVDRSR